MFYVSAFGVLYLLLEMQYLEGRRQREEEGGGGGVSIAFTSVTQAVGLTSAAAQPLMQHGASSMAL